MISEHSFERVFGPLGARTLTEAERKHEKEHTPILQIGGYGSFPQVDRTCTDSLIAEAAN